MCYVIDWWTVQSVPCLSPNTCWDRLQPTANLNRLAAWVEIWFEVWFLISFVAGPFSYYSSEHFFSGIQRKLLSLLTFMSFIDIVQNAYRVATKGTVKEDKFEKLANRPIRKEILTGSGDWINVAEPAVQAFRTSDGPLEPACKPPAVSGNTVVNSIVRVCLVFKTVLKTKNS